MVSPSSSSTAAPEILTATLLEAPAPTSHPRGIQRSQDGQYLVVTTRILSITTPTTALAAGELPQGQSAYIPGVDAQATKNIQDRQEPTQRPEPATIFTTKIKLPHVDDSHDWAEQAKGGGTDDRVITLGSHPSEPEWRAACWSPSGVNPLGGCVLAALTSNLEVYVYAPPKNPLMGEWTPSLGCLTYKLLDATDFPQSTRQTAAELKSWEGNEQWQARRVMDCQTLCMAWSPRIDGGQLSGHSVLALGHKSGSITFWSVNKNLEMELLYKVKASDRWISSLTFQDWNYSSTSKASIRIACTTPAGSITVAQLSLDASDLTTLKLDSTDAIHEIDDRPLTGLEWSGPDKELLISTRPGKVTLWSPGVKAGSRGWAGEKTVLLAKLGDSPGSSKLSTCSGVNTFTPTSIVITLADGSFHLIDSLDMPNPKYNLAVSKYMTKAAREVFEETEATRVKKELFSQAVMRCSGAIYLGQGIWVWLHQPTTPHDISYQIPSVLFSTIVTCHIPTHSQPQRATHLKGLQKALDKVTTTLDSSSSALIAPYLVPFRCKPTSSPSNFDLLSPHLLRTLRQIPSAGDDQPAATLQTACPDRLKDVKPWFVKGLRKALWETSSLAKLRVRYTLASYLSTVEGPQKDEFAAQTQALSRLIISQSLGIILDWAGRVKSFITGPTDLQYLTHLIHALLSIYLSPPLPSSSIPIDLPATSHLAGAAFDLALSFDPALSIAVDPEALEELIQNARLPPSGSDEMVPEWAKSRVGSSASWLGEGGGEVTEVCPGCEEEVRFGDLELGVCREGHVFDRCSISLGVIAAAQHRKCLTCARPAILPASLSRSRSEDREAKVEVQEGEVPAEGADGDVVMQEEGGGGGAGEAAESGDWLLELVLESGKACIYCGGRFALAM